MTDKLFDEFSPWLSARDCTEADHSRPTGGAPPWLSHPLHASACPAPSAGSWSLILRHRCPRRKLDADAEAANLKRLDLHATCLAQPFAALASAPPALASRSCWPGRARRTDRPHDPARPWVSPGGRAGWRPRPVQVRSIFVGRSPKSVPSFSSHPCRLAGPQAPAIEIATACLPPIWRSPSPPRRGLHPRWQDARVGPARAESRLALRQASADARGQASAHARSRCVPRRSIPTSVPAFSSHPCRFAGPHVRTTLPCLGHCASRHLGD